MQPVEVYVDDESKLTLHGLVQHYTMLTEEQKNKRLMDLLDQLDFNQVSPCSSAEIRHLLMLKFVLYHCASVCHYKQLSEAWQQFVYRQFTVATSRQTLSMMFSNGLPFMQVVIFVKNAKRAQTLAALLEKCQFPATYITAQMEQKKRLDVYR